MTTNIETQHKTHEHDLAWWIILLQGILSIIIGLLFIVSPKLTTLMIVQILGIYWMVSGVFSLVSIFVDNHLWGWKLFSGAIGILAGIYVVQNPVLAAIFIPAVMVTVLGIQGIMYGIILFIEAFKGLGVGSAILGVLSILLGIVLIASPLFAVKWFILMLGVVSIIGGLVAIIYAISASRKKA